MLVTVIIPTHNRERCIADAVRSALAQTYFEREVIVVDDGSTDRTSEIVNRFDEVRYVRRERGRQAAARSTGLSIAKGELIATLDSDDEWDPEFLERSVRFLRRHELDFVFSNWRTDRNGIQRAGSWEISGRWERYARRPEGDWYLLEPLEVRQLFIETCPAPSSSLLIRRSSIVSEWNSELHIADDWCFILDMAVERECRAGFTMEKLWTKRVRSDNVYDGRNRGEIAKELEIHDTRLMRKRHARRLSARERFVFDRRIVRGYAVRVLFYLRDSLGIRNPKRWLGSELESFE